MGVANISLQEAADRLGITRAGLSVQVSRSEAFRERLGAKKMGPIWTVDEKKLEDYRKERRGQKSDG